MSTSQKTAGVVRQKPGGIVSGRLLSLLLGLLGISAPTPVFARDLYVSQWGTHLAPYTNWITAATNISAAVAESRHGDTIYITNGVYTLLGQVSITNGIRLTGVNGAAATVVSGGYPLTTNRCFYICHSNAVVEALTFSNGWAIGESYMDVTGYGGSILCESGEVRDCVLVNSAATVGGAIACYRGGVVRGCVVQRNTAALGGGVALVADNRLVAFGSDTSTGGVPAVEACTIVDNVATDGGGGVWCWAGGRVRNSTVSRNSAQTGGGGIACYLGGEITQCTVTSNSADMGGGVTIQESGAVQACEIAANQAGEGGGLLLFEGGVAENCLVTENRATSGGGVLFYEGGIFRNSTVVFNIATNGGGIYSLLAGETVDAIVVSNIAMNGSNWLNDQCDSNYVHTCSLPLPPGTGNITNDPQFVDTAKGNYRLSASSACIDAGTAYGAPNRDLDGVPRPLDGDNDGTPTVDMGCYEHLNPIADTDGDGMPDGWEASQSFNLLSDDAQGDPDSDGMPNVGEYVSDTDPHDADSVLSLIRVDRQFGGIRLDWKGGREAWQILECRGNLASTTEQWTAIFALPPPTALTNAVIDMGATNAVLFYRIRAER